jgi:alkaline phosphatase
MLKRERIRRFTFVGLGLSALLALLTVGPVGETGATARAQAPDRPQTVIIMFADGTGAAQWELGRYASRQLRDDPFAVTDTVFGRGSLGLMTTHAATTIATDSAAAGSAMSTGSKTTIGSIGMTPDGQSPITVMEAAKASGKGIGLVTTATIYDATPAAFSVHARNRGDSQVLVDQLAALEPDVLLGGGRDYFLPTGARGGKRNDGRDVLAELQQRGYQVATTPDELSDASSGRLLGLFAEADLDSELDRDPDEQPSLAQMAAAAIRVLSNASPNGFVLLVETENTDVAGHNNDVAALIRDLWAFDEAVRLALAFQDGAPTETLVVVTGDHETGGLSITYAQKDASSLASANRFYAAPEHLALVAEISLSFARAAELLGPRPTPEALDQLLAEHFPGFRLDEDLRQAILAQRTLDLHSIYPTANALGRMVSRRTGIYWGTSGHSAEPVVIGALGPSSERFRGYLDNTDFGHILHELIAGGEDEPGAALLDYWYPRTKRGEEVGRVQQHAGYGMLLFSLWVRPF